MKERLEMKTGQTKLTRHMLKYLRTVYQNENWLIRLIWNLKVSMMDDSEIMKTYHMLTDRR